MLRVPAFKVKLNGAVPPEAEVNVQELARPTVVYKTVLVSKAVIGILTVTRSAVVAVSPTESVTVTVSL